MKRKATKLSKRVAEESVYLVMKLQTQEADTEQNIGIVWVLFQDTNSFGVNQNYWWSTKYEHLQTGHWCVRDS